MGLTMIVYRTIAGPFVEPDGTYSALMQTDQGEVEFMFDTFTEFYEMDINLPMDADDDEWEWVEDEDEEQGEFDFDQG